MLHYGLLWKVEGTDYSFDKVGGRADGWSEESWSGATMLAAAAAAVAALFAVVSLHVTAGPMLALAPAHPAPRSTGTTSSTR